MNDGRGGRVLDGNSVGTVRRDELECTVRVGCINSVRRPNLPTCRENRVHAPQCRRDAHTPAGARPVRAKYHFQLRFVSE
jgi:hypothetical protein